MFHKNTRALAVLFMISLFATASFAQGGTATSGKDATATKKSTKSDAAATKTKKADLVDINCRQQGRAHRASWNRRRLQPEDH